MRVELRVAVLALAASLTACEWFSDFKRQPSVVTAESLYPDSLVVRGAPQGSVPTTGTAVAEFQVSRNALTMATIDSMSSLVNPTPPNEASLANGRKYYQINCAVCHGDTGNGLGPATKYGMFPFPLNGDITKNRTDGYIFGMIRNGRNNMPSYNRIEEMDRWDVVNYLRGLQGKLSAPVPTGAVGAPGETGATLPGPTRLGPTHPAPWTPRGAASAAAPPPAAAPRDSASPAARPGAKP